jgi:hypothetical protein
MSRYSHEGRWNRYHFLALLFAVAVVAVLMATGVIDKPPR